MSTLEDAGVGPDEQFSDITAQRIRSVLFHYGFELPA